MVYSARELIAFAVFVVIMVALFALGGLQGALLIGRVHVHHRYNRRYPWLCTAVSALTVYRPRATRRSVVLVGRRSCAPGTLSVCEISGMPVALDARAAAVSTLRS